MENNRKDRVWEEDIPMRKLTVDDAVLFNLKKIYFRQVEELCAPVLKKAGYSVGKIGFRNVNVFTTASAAYCLCSCLKQAAAAKIFWPHMRLIRRKFIF